VLPCSSEKKGKEGEGDDWWGQGVGEREAGSGPCWAELWLLGHEKKERKGGQVGCGLVGKEKSARRLLGLLKSLGPKGIRHRCLDIYIYIYIYICLHVYI
jgi:hypothetical protein